MIFSRTLVAALLVSLVTAGAGRALNAQVNNDAPASNKAQAKSTFLKEINGPKTLNMGLAYWIELNRQGHLYRTSNMAKFQSGDQIRFHVLPSADAYTYIVMHKGTTGSKSVLFPPEGSTGGSGARAANFIKGGAECVVPQEGSLEFDGTPGIEQVGLIVSRNQIDAVSYINDSQANVSADIAVHESNSESNSDSEAQSDLEKAFDAVTSTNPGALEVLSTVHGAVAPEAKEHVLASPSTAVVLGKGKGGVVSVDFSLTHD